MVSCVCKNVQIIVELVFEVCLEYEHFTKVNGAFRQLCLQMKMP